MKQTTVKLSEEATKRLSEIIIEIGKESGNIEKKSRIVNHLLLVYSDEVITDFKKKYSSKT